MASLRAVLRQAPRTQSLLARPLTGTAAPLTRRAFATSVRRGADNHVVTELEEAERLAEDGDDPNMNGNYPDPSLTSALPVKRQFRDPYADWWDPIERRNYGEPVHEDDDILGVFSPEEYTHFSPAWGAVLMGCFVATFGVLCAVVARVYPDMCHALSLVVWRLSWEDRGLSVLGRSGMRKACFEEELTLGEKEPRLLYVYGSTTDV